MPAAELSAAWSRPPPLFLTGFALAVLIVIALFPVGRLLLIGGAEFISPYELLAIVFGTYAAAAIATLAFLFSIEAASERHHAAIEAQREAGRLAVATGNELFKLKARALGCGYPPAAQSAADPLPRIIEAGFLSSEGTPKARAECAVFDIAKGSNISARPYFMSLRDTPRARIGENKRSFVITEVRAQTDGVKKTVLLVRIDKGDAPPNYLLASTFIRNLVAPVLPPFQHYMVVDTADDRLPVLFHSENGRALLRQFSDQIRGGPEIARALQRASHHGQIRPPAFVRRYDGRAASFSGAPIAGTNWAVLIYHPLDEVDAIAAQTTLRALTAWAGITIPAMFLGAFHVLRRRDAWRCLWPSAQHNETYLAGTSLAAVASLFIIILALHASPLAPLVAVVIGAVACLAAFEQLRSPVQMRTARIKWLYTLFELRAPAAGRVATRLSTETESAYRYFVLAMLACVAIAPMVAFWSDARNLSRHLVDVQRMDVAAQSGYVSIGTDRRASAGGAIKGEGLGRCDRPCSFHTWTRQRSLRAVGQERDRCWYAENPA